MSVLAIIPARSGSKGIPNKNFKPLAGITPIDRVCRAAALAGIREFVVSTDRVWESEFFTDHCTPGEREALLETVGRWKLRPAELAQDNTPMIDVVKHVLEQIPGEPDQKIVLLQPTQPLRKPEHITHALALLTPEVDSVVSVVELPKTHAIEMQLHIEDNGRLYPARWWCECGPERMGDQPATRQELRETYVRDGTCYAFRRSTVSAYGNIYGMRVKPLLIDPRETCALDSPEDWAEAERRLRARESA